MGDVWERNDQDAQIKIKDMVSVLLSGHRICQQRYAATDKDEAVSTALTPPKKKVKIETPESANFMTHYQAFQVFIKSNGEAGNDGRSG